MNLLITAGLWAGLGLGVVIMLSGLTGRPPLLRAERVERSARTIDRSQLARAGAAIALALVLLLATGWIAAALLAAAGVWFAPPLLGGRAARETAVARTEAIAAWTEMVRDSIVAASGLEEAIVATGPVAPEAIAGEVQALAVRLDPHTNIRLTDALEAFAADLRHPSADLVVAALVLAARMEASDLSGLLSRLADAIRDDARMRIRVEVGRTRVRTAAKVIVAVVAATIGLLATLNRDYLWPYNEPTGQVVLLVVGGIFALGGWLLDRMATIEAPERFTARRNTGRPSWS
jgi:Flp pilus assembly protein TadB